MTDEWQGIATAPKDGTWVLTWTADMSHDDGPFLVCRWHRGEWVAEGNSGFYDPTVWRPLPEPPE